MASYLLVQFELIPSPSASSVRWPLEVNLWPHNCDHFLGPESEYSGSRTTAEFLWTNLSGWSVSRKGDWPQIAAVIYHRRAWSGVGSTLALQPFQWKVPSIWTNSPSDTCISQSGFVAMYTLYIVAYGVYVTYRYLYQEWILQKNAVRVTFDCW